MKQISDNEIYLLIKYKKSVLWRAAKRLFYIEDARCLKFNVFMLKGNRFLFLHISVNGNGKFVYLIILIVTTSCIAQIK